MLDHQLLKFGHETLTGVWGELECLHAMLKTIHGNILGCTLPLIIDVLCLGLVLVTACPKVAGAVLSMSLILTSSGA